MSARRHHCPGGCGRTPLVRTYICPACMSTLPRTLARSIIATTGKPSGAGGRAASLREAVEYLERNK